MINLRELFKVFWTITEIRITARDPAGKFLHEWIYEENVQPSIHMERDIELGRLTVFDKKINAHGDPVRGGAEMGWGVKEDLFPKAILDAPIRHLTGAGHEVHSLLCDIEMQPITVETIVRGEKHD